MSDKRQRYNDLKIALEVYTKLHSPAVEKNAPELTTHRAAVVRDIKATLEQIEAAKTPGI
jgi:hypothetical protein